MGNNNRNNWIKDTAVLVGILSFTWMLFGDLFVLGAVANVLAWLVYAQMRMIERNEGKPKRVFVRNSRFHK